MPRTRLVGAGSTAANPHRTASERALLWHPNDIDAYSVFSRLASHTVGVRVGDLIEERAASRHHGELGPRTSGRPPELLGLACGLTAGVAVAVLDWSGCVSGASCLVPAYGVGVLALPAWVAKLLAARLDSESQHEAWVSPFSGLVVAGLIVLIAWVPFRTATIANVVRQGDAVRSHVEAYIAAHGHAPTDLAEMYRSEPGDVPRPRGCGASEWRFEASTGDDSSGDRGWELSTACGLLGGPNWLGYRSDRDYRNSGCPREDGWCAVYY